MCHILWNGLVACCCCGACHLDSTQMRLRDDEAAPTCCTYMLLWTVLSLWALLRAYAGLNASRLAACWRCFTLAHVLSTLDSLTHASQPISIQTMGIHTSDFGAF
jgi:hypothetical protein